MKYEDFVIEIGPDRGEGHSVRVLDSPAGQGRGALALDVTSSQWRALLEDLTHRRRPDAAETPSAVTDSGRLVTPVSTVPELSAIELGDRLFQSLFSGQIRSLYDQSLGKISGRTGQGLRIKLKLDPRHPSMAELSALPWELVCRSETGEFLTLSRFSPIVRYLDVPRPPSALPLPSPLRILVVVSSPEGLPPLDLDRERGHLEAVWAAEEAVEITYLEEASMSSLRRTLLAKDFHVLHFMGHGGFDAASGQGVLYFQGANGKAHAVPGQDLATKLADFRTLRLIFLNACETARTGDGDGAQPFAGVASALVLGGMPAVVAMQLPISDESAIAFSQAFYRQLAEGDPVDAALSEGRQAIHSASPTSVEWSIPVLFMRIPDGTIFHSDGEATGEPGHPGFQTQPIPATDDSSRSKPGSRATGFRLAAIFTLAALLFWTVYALDLGLFDSRAEAEPGILPVNESASEDADAPAKNVLQTTSLDAPPTITESAATPPPKKPEPQEAIGPPAPQGVGVLDRSHSFKASVSGLKGRLTGVDLLEGGKMCFKLELDNQSGRAVEVGFSRAESYLADERGNPYNVLSTIFSKSPEDSFASLAPGKSERLWIVFEGPRAGAKVFTAFLESHDRGALRFEPFRVEISKVDPKLARPAPAAAKLPKGAMPIELERLTFSTGNQKLIGAVTGLVFIERSGHDVDVPRRMRWNLEFQNSSYEDLSLGFTLASVHLQDDLGNIYPLLTQSPEMRAMEGVYIDKLRRGLRRDLWFEFPAPRPGSKSFEVKMASDAGNSIEYKPFEVELPKSAMKFRYEPQLVSFEPEESEKIAVNGLDGIEAEVLQVERLANGRLRWTVEMTNRSSTAKTVGFNYSRVRLSDGRRQYDLLATNSGGDVETSYRERLAGGESVYHWFDFPEPRHGREKFDLILSSHDGSFRFAPFPVELGLDALGEYP